MFCRFNCVFTHFKKHLQIIEIFYLGQIEAASVQVSLYKTKKPSWSWNTPKQTSEKENVRSSLSMTGDYWHQNKIKIAKQGVKKICKECAGWEHNIEISNKT